MSDWRIAGDVERMELEARADYFDERPALEREARADELSELTPAERASLRRRRRAFRVPVRREDFGGLSHDDEDAPF